MEKWKVLSIIRLMEIAYAKLPGKLGSTFPFSVLYDYKKSKTIWGNNTSSNLDDTEVISKVTIILRSRSHHIWPRGQVTWTGIFKLSSRVFFENSWTSTRLIALQPLLPLKYRQEFYGEIVNTSLQMAYLHSRIRTRIQTPNPMAALHYAEVFTLHRVQFKFQS